MFKKFSFLKALIILEIVSFTVAGMVLTASLVSQNAVAGVTSQKSQVSQIPTNQNEPLTDIINERFSVDNSLNRIKQIREALSSFRQLTNKSRQTLGNSVLQSVGNTDPEIQNLGFYNWTSAVEGTVKKQEYEIKKLQYELAQKQYKDGEISKSELDKKFANYQKAKQEFQAFLKSFNIAD